MCYPLLFFYDFAPLYTKLHLKQIQKIEYVIPLRSALFVDSLSTDCAIFIDSLPAFRPAEVA